MNLLTGIIEAVGGGFEFGAGLIGKAIFGLVELTHGGCYIAGVIVLLIAGVLIIMPGPGSQATPPTPDPWQAIEAAGTAQAQQPNAAGQTLSQPVSSNIDFADAVVSGPEMLVDGSTTCNLSNGTALTLTAQDQHLNITAAGSSFSVADVDISGHDDNHDGWVTLPKFGNLGVKYTIQGGWTTAGCTVQ